jgi:hypothetical protein
MNDTVGLINYYIIWIAHENMKKKYKLTDISVKVDRKKKKEKIKSKNNKTNILNKKSVKNYYTNNREKCDEFFEYYGIDEDIDMIYKNYILNAQSHEVYNFFYNHIFNESGVIRLAKVPVSKTMF